jgi:predicted ArsR family transcriptional regulator
MQALQATISRTQQIFETIANNGPLSISALAKKFDITTTQMMNYVQRLQTRGYIKKTYSATSPMQVSAAISKEQAVFQEKRKDVYVTNTKAAAAPKLTLKQRIYKLLEGTSSYNPTEVTDVLADTDYQTVRSSMQKMYENGVLTRSGPQYSVVKDAYSKLQASAGRPTGSFKLQVEINGALVRISAREALKLKSKLNKASR